MNPEAWGPADWFAIALVFVGVGKLFGYALVWLVGALGIAMTAVYKAGKR